MNGCISSEPRHFRPARAADAIRHDAGRSTQRPALLCEANVLVIAGPSRCCAQAASVDATWWWIEHEGRMKHTFGSCNETLSHETIAAVTTLAAHAYRI
jgi:hypothetical protein